MANENMWVTEKDRRRLMILAVIALIVVAVLIWEIVFKFKSPEKTITNSEIDLNKINLSANISTEIDETYEDDFKLGCLGAQQIRDKIKAYEEAIDKLKHSVELQKCPIAKDIAE